MDDVRAIHRIPVLELAHLNLLVFSSLFPNHVRRQHGVFIKERIVHFARRDGGEVRVVAPVPYFPLPRLGRWSQHSQVARREVIEGLDVYHPRYLITPKVGMTLYGSMMYRSVLPFVRRLQSEADFDLIDAHYVYPDGFAAVELGRRLGKPVVVSARGTDINLYATFPLIRRRLQRTLARAHRVIAVSDALRQAIVALGIPADKIDVIPNGVDAEKFRPAPQGQARAKLGLPSGPIVLAVGHLDVLKGCDLLVRALGILARRRPVESPTLVFVGEGDDRQKLIRLAGALGLEDRVRFVSNRPHDELYLWYSAADVLCLASSREGWPNVLLEAMACGTPVVGTRVGGVPEIVATAEVGLLTERDPASIAARLEEALARAWDREAIVAYARQHSWARVAASMSRVFGAATNGRVPPVA